MSANEAVGLGSELGSGLGFLLWSDMVADVS